MHRVPMVTDDPSPVAAPGGPPARLYQRARRRPDIVPASLKKRDNRDSQPLFDGALLSRVLLLFSPKRNIPAARGQTRNVRRTTWVSRDKRSLAEKSSIIAIIRAGEKTLRDRRKEFGSYTHIYMYIMRKREKERGDMLIKWRR